MADRISLSQLERLRVLAYNEVIFEKLDYGRVNKILNALASSKVSKDNYWDVIRKFTKNVKSDHTIRRWEIIADWFYNKLGYNN